MSARNQDTKQRSVEQTRNLVSSGVYDNNLDKAHAKDQAKSRIASCSVEERRQLANRAFNNKVSTPFKVGIIIFMVVLLVVSFRLGKYPVSLSEIWSFLVYLAHAFVQDPWGVISGAWSPDVSSKTAIALWNIRLPRILMVVLVGAALSVAGAAYQGMFRNPLVSPDILGSSAGASLGACLALLLDLPGYMVQVFAFAGGMLAVAFVVYLNRLTKYDAILGLVLGGILISSLFSSGTSLIKCLADANDKLPEITFWLMGSFNDINGTDLRVVFFPMLAGFALLILESWKLNVLSFGDDEARAMGVNTKAVRIVVIFASTLVVSCSVAVSGIIGYVGLVVPHLARALVGPNYKVLLPVSMVVGGGYLLIVDNLARLVASVEVPIGILTSIVGIPFFLFIFKRNMRGWL